MALLDGIVRHGPILILDQSISLAVASLAVQIQMTVLDLAEFAKHLPNIVLLRLFVNVGDEDDPSLDGSFWGPPPRGGTSSVVVAAASSAAAVIWATAAAGPLSFALLLVVAILPVSGAGARAGARPAPRIGTSAAAVAVAVAVPAAAALAASAIRIAIIAAAPAPARTTSRSGQYTASVSAECRAHYRSSLVCSTR